MALRYVLASVIVLAGFAWALAWIVGTIRSAKREDYSSLRKIPVPVAAAWLTTAAYALFYYINALMIGGTPASRIGPRSPYVLNWSGKTTEVTRALYIRSEIGEALLILLLLISLAMTWKLLPKAKSQ